ncbi:nitrogen regulation protein NR(II) [Kerstersia gyiorum]|uniref:Sensory histidine kinase/phosphatase NtrB n=1 Tax=Kerstersia gyiorum TaxID=206506 RepID=A0A171KQX9_9BURK|nr:nitrogen regulation protein NR(II) [Kerstersia gyiorum]KKO71296.1 histidine kinase [Kerstersia gyiorum]
MNLDALDLLACSVLLVDEQGRVAHANSAAEDVFGRARRRLAGVSVERLFVEAADIRAAVAASQSDGFADLRLHLQARRGLSETPAVAVTVLTLAAQAWPTLIEVREVTQAQLADRNSQIYASLQGQRELLRNLAHEIKNPLGGLRGAAQLLESELPDPALKEYTQVIISEADRLQALVDRLAASQRIAAVRRAPTNIHEVCERVCALIRAEFRDDVVLQRDYDASVPEIMADAERLIQALLNVMRNAAQALTQPTRTPNARITLRTRVMRRVIIGGRQERMALAVSVIDNGPGVPEGIQDRVFHPLVTGRASGTGLGLSLAQDFLQQHDGVIEFRSEPGNTEFSLVLPMELA